MDHRKKMIIIISSLLVILLLGGIIFLVFKVTEKKCPIDYELEDKVCTKIEEIDPIVTTYCSTGYLQENDKCYKNEIIAPSIRYYCENTSKVSGDVVSSSSVLTGTTCTYTLSHTPITKKKCLGNAVPYSDTKCKATFITQAASRIDVITHKTMYYCIGDEILSGDECILITYPDYIYETQCVSGFTLISNKCSKTYTYDASWNATCPVGFTYVNKYTCTRTLEENLKYEYNCPTDYQLVGKKCQKKVYLDY